MINIISKGKFEEHIFAYIAVIVFLYLAGYEIGKAIAYLIK